MVNRSMSAIFNPFDSPVLHTWRMHTLTTLNIGYFLVLGQEGDVKEDLFGISLVGHDNKLGDALVGYKVILDHHLH